MAPHEMSGAAASSSFMARLLGRRPYNPPQKALILQPCCLGRVMQTTPLLAALSAGFPTARFDWAVSEWARQSVATNRRLTRVILTGPGDIEHNSPQANQALVERLREEAYDTCFIPSRSGILEKLAKDARIPQRISLNSHSKGRLPGEQRLAETYLSLATAAGVEPAIIQSVEMEFEPPDHDRMAVTRWLVEEYDWLGDAPLVVLHPGGGDNPERVDLNIRWPVERFARLTNYLVRNHGARVVIVGTAEETSLANQIAGLVSYPVVNRAGRIGLGELGALCELAAMYVGNDSGTTYIAAATGCPTLVIYGPTSPAMNGPYMISGRIICLWHPFADQFSWQHGVTVDEAVEAAESLRTVSL